MPAGELRPKSEVPDAAFRNIAQDDETRQRVLDGGTDGRYKEFLAFGTHGELHHVDVPRPYAGQKRVAAVPEQMAALRARLNVSARALARSVAEATRRDPDAVRTMLARFENGKVATLPGDVFAALNLLAVEVDHVPFSVADLYPELDAAE